MKKLIATSLFLALATPARADTVFPADTVGTVGYWLRDAKAGTYKSLVYGELDKTENGSSRCLDALTYMKGKGVWLLESDVFEIYGGKRNEYKQWVLTVDEAAKICKEASFYKDVVFKDFSMFRELDFDAAELEKADYSRSAVESLQKDIDRCPAAVDALLAVKPATLPFKVGAAQTVGDLKPLICERAKKEAAAYLTKLGEKDAKAKDPYIKAGIKGDKLDLMMEYDGSIFLTGKRAPDGIKPYAQASVMFTWSTSDEDDAGYVVHSVTKYVFKGNNLAHTSSKTYRKRKGEDLGASAFK